MDILCDLSEVGKWRSCGVCSYRMESLRIVRDVIVLVNCWVTMDLKICGVKVEDCGCVGNRNALTRWNPMCGFNPKTRIPTKPIIWNWKWYQVYEYSSEKRMVWNRWRFRIEEGMGHQCRILGCVVEGIGSDERMWNDSADTLWTVVVEREVVPEPGLLRWTQMWLLWSVCLCVEGSLDHTLLMCKT